MPDARWGGLGLRGVAVPVALPRCRAMLFGPGFAVLPRVAQGPRANQVRPIEHTHTPRTGPANPAPRAGPANPPHRVSPASQPTAPRKPPTQCSMGRTWFVWGGGIRSVVRCRAMLFGPSFAVLPRVAQGPRANQVRPIEPTQPPRTDPATPAPRTNPANSITAPGTRWCHPSPPSQPRHPNHPTPTALPTTGHSEPEVPTARWGGLVLRGGAAVVAFQRGQGHAFRPQLCGPATTGAGAPRKQVRSIEHTAPPRIQRNAAGEPKII
ncbi:hypothetical protein JOD54_002126 [Actinokineospora baliensis]|nr:hypothetical protein [Actinokineospora baliensis]